MKDELDGLWDVVERVGVSFVSSFECLAMDGTDALSSVFLN